MKETNFSNLGKAVEKVNASISDTFSKIKTPVTPKFDFPRLDLDEIPDFETTLPPSDVSKERLDYEDSLFSDLAKDIKAVQLETNRQLQLLVEENRKAEKFSRKIIVATLIVSILTLLATVIGILL